jgi:uncharacterized protein HemY
MWEMIGFAAGMVILMLLFALIPHVFTLPEAIANYFRGRAWRSEAIPTSADPDEKAARVLGEGLSRGMSSETVAEVTAAFWSADPANRRALAYLVAGLTANGGATDEDVLAVVRGLSARSASPSDETSFRA